jgi:hypothetical protein
MQLSLLRLLAHNNKDSVPNLLETVSVSIIRGFISQVSHLCTVFIPHSKLQAVPTAPSMEQRVERDSSCGPFRGAARTAE